MIKQIGFLVNPIAGVGGELAWKGTDQVQEAWKATNYLGSKRCKQRALIAIQSLKNVITENVTFFVPGGVMGREHFLEFIHDDRIITLTHPKIPTTPQDTIEFLEQLKKQEPIDLLVFVGGDGTATLIARFIKSRDWDLPVIGIPSGVKITSECFLKSPSDLEPLLREWVQHDNISFHDALVTDLDEEMYQQGKVVKQHWGMVRVPHVPRLLQGVKLTSSEMHNARESFQEQVESIAEDLKRRNVLTSPLIIGPGSTTKAVFKTLGIEKTLLGVDVIADGKIVIADANCEELTQWFNNLFDEEKKHVKIILTPIGGQGFILGRGNQQICCGVLNNIQPTQLIIVATEEKLRETPRLLIDTDCHEFNQRMRNRHLLVIHGFKRAMIRKVES